MYVHMYVHTLRDARAQEQEREPQKQSASTEHTIRRRGHGNGVASLESFPSESSDLSWCGRESRLS